MKQPTLFGLGNTTNFVEELQAKYAINYETAKRAHYWTSHASEQRGKQEVEGFKQAIAEYFEKLRQNSVIPQAEWEADFEHFVSEMHKRETSLLVKRSSLASTFVTGGSKFPHRQQKKRNDYNQALNENIEWRRWAFNKLMNKVTAKTAIKTGASDALRQLEAKRDALKKELANLKNRPHPSYKGDYLRRQIKDAEKRIEIEQRLQKDAAQGVKEYEFNGGRIEGNAAINRWQVFFDTKPDAGMIANLKQNGFKWSPSNQAWQRFYHTTSLEKLKWVLGDIYPKPKVEESREAEEIINFDDFTPEESDKDYVLAIAKYEGYELLNTPLSALDGLSQQEQKTYKALIQDFVDEIAKDINLYAKTFGINKNSLDYDYEELKKIARIVDYLADKYKSQGIQIMVAPDKLNPSNNVNTHVRITLPNARYTFDVQHVLPQVAYSMGIKKPQPNFGANAALSPETWKNLEALKKYTNNKSFSFERAVHTIPGGYFASNGHMAVFIADESAKEYISDRPMDDYMKGNLFEVLLLHENYIGTLLNLKQLERFKGIPPTHPYDVQRHRILINGFALYVSGVTLNLFVKSIKEFIVKRANNTPVYLYGGKDRIITTTVPPDVNLVDALKSKKYDFSLMNTSIAMRKDEYITYDTLNHLITTADATGIVDIYDSQFEIPARIAKHATAKLAAVKLSIGDLF